MTDQEGVDSVKGRLETASVDKTGSNPPEIIHQRSQMIGDVQVTFTIGRIPNGKIPAGQKGQNDTERE